MNIPRGLVRIVPSELPLLARQQLKEQLVVYPQATSSFNDSPEPIKLWDEDDNYLYVPRGYYNCYLKKRFGCEGKLDYSNGRNDLRPTTPITPREGQAEVLDRTMAALTMHEFGGAIIEAMVSSGKTAMALETARRLGMKTLIVVHTTVLAEQWIKEIKKFFPEWTTGIIQADKIETHDRDICVGIINSLAMKKDYPEWLFDEFGFVVFDEIHKMSSQEFGKVFSRLRAKYMLGLSGTLTRSDRAENVFKFGVGTVVKAMQSIDVLRPKIYAIDTKYVFASTANNIDRQKARFLKKLICDPARNSLIIQNTVKAAMAGRHVLVLTERVDHVESLYSSLVRELVPRGITVGMMVGSTPKALREKHQAAQVLIATSQLLGTGFNNPKLSVLIFATPIQSVVQCVGRIIRRHPDKKEPMVVDLVDSGSKMAMVLGKSRMNKYRAQGWDIVAPKGLFDRV